MNLTDVLSDLDEVVLIQLDEPWRCESMHHGRYTRWSHLHQGDATWYQFGPCHHMTGLRCDQYVQAIKANSEIADDGCLTCGVAGVLSFEPLGITR